MKVLVCGGRDYGNRAAVDRHLRRLSAARSLTCVIHGGARGADTLAGMWARSHGVQEVICPANWDAHGKAAGPKRNRAMLALRPDLVLAFPGGRGTENMVLQASGAGVEVYRVTDAGSESREG